MPLFQCQLSGNVFEFRGHNAVEMRKHGDYKEVPDDFLETTTETIPWPKTRSGPGVQGRAHQGGNDRSAQLGPVPKNKLQKVSSTGSVEDLQ